MRTLCSCIVAEARICTIFICRRSLTLYSTRILAPRHLSISGLNSVLNSRAPVCHRLFPGTPLNKPPTFFSGLTKMRWVAQTSIDVSVDVVRSEHNSILFLVSVCWGGNTAGPDTSYVQRKCHCYRLLRFPRIRRVGCSSSGV